MSWISMRLHTAIHSASASSSVARSNTMRVASMTTSSADLSPSRLLMKPSMASAGEMSCTARYLSTPQRAMHSSISSKSSETSTLAAAPATDSFCELTKASLACGSDRRHLNSVPVRSSPTTSEPCRHVKVPSTFSDLSICTHCAVPTLPISSSGTLSYQACSRSRFASSTPSTAASAMTVSRNSTASSRWAFGSTLPLSIFSRDWGTGSNESWCSIVSSPNSGLSRQKETRTSTLRNSCSTSCASAAGPASPLPDLLAVLNCFFMSSKVYGSPLLVSSMQSTTKS
mmetsp:Transcript_32760/g.74038  ORF Transcript_32760/g.74038 Transcript_32760/m.74038 type:complete len:286 (-) Transcript_32760:1500-2357(-)